MPFVKNEKNPPPSSPFTPPLSKPWKQTEKTLPPSSLLPPPSSNLIVDGLLDKIDLTLTLQA